MARDGSGGYNLPELPFVFDTVIEETKVNNNFSDLGTEIANSLAKDGQTLPTGNLPMNSKKHTGVANASARDEYAAVGQVQDGAFTYAGAAGGTANALTVSLSPAVTALVEGGGFVFKAASNNTGAATIAVNGLSAVALQINGAALSSGDIVANKFYEALYDGTAVQITRLSVAAGDLVSSNNLSDLDNISTARTNLGLGALATLATVDTAQIDNDAVSLAKMASGTAGNMITYDASGNPAAVATGTAGQVLTSNGAGAAPTMQDSGGTFGSALLHVRDKRSSGNAGGTFTAGAWRTRTLQTVVTNEITGASLASNQITLPAGTYFIIASCPATLVDDHQSRLQNVTDASTELVGTNERTSSADSVNTRSFVTGRFTLSAEKDLELQHRCDTTRATNGFGVAMSFTDEIYADVLIWKVA